MAWHAGSKIRWLALLALPLWMAATASTHTVGGGVAGVAFISADALKNFDRTNHEVSGTEGTPALDLLGSYSGTRFRLLAEYFTTDDEHELERLQFGWSRDEDLIVWVGRYHRPYSYWNTRLHHGQYLQTTIARPALEQWEDDGGILPSHSTGVLVDLTRSVGERSSLQFAFAAGAGTELDDSGLEPLDVTDPSGSHGLALDFRVAYLPDALEENQLGATASYSHIDSKTDSAMANSIADDHQTTLTLYGDWRWQQWHLLSTLVFVSNDLHYYAGSDSTESFLAGYTQLEWQINEGVTLYGRQENTWGNGNSDYLAYFDEYARRVSKLGIRLDAFKRQAFTLEISNEKTSETHFHQIRVQWSTALQ